MTANIIAQGKAKNLYSWKKNQVRMVFKDSLTAFNGSKKSSFKGKGEINRNVSSLVFRYLKKQGIKNHYLKNQGSKEMICDKMTMIPLEVVVRNRLTGSTAKKFKKKEEKKLKKALVEFYYKDDALKDPFISQEQIVLLFDFINLKELNFLKTQALKINTQLQFFFKSVGLELVDFKLEFGRKGRQLLLGDEFSCDSCRLWDIKTGKKMDKDRFRLNLGQVKESYQKVHDLLDKKWDKKLP